MASLIVEPRLVRNKWRIGLKNSTVFYNELVFTSSLECSETCDMFNAAYYLHLARVIQDNLIASIKAEKAFSITLEETRTGLDVCNDSIHVSLLSDFNQIGIGQAHKIERLNLYPNTRKHHSILKHKIAMHNLLNPDNQI